jgi:AhpD family alkylhydroperoxidase
VNDEDENIMADRMYPPVTREIAQTRRDLTPETQSAFDTFSRKVFNEGALSARMKQIIAVAVAHATQCPYCIKGHTKAALRSGATRVELMEAIWVATEIRAGGAYAHSTLAIDVFEEEQANSKRSPGGG